jgi:hypothetical protein
MTPEQEEMLNNLIKQYKLTEDQLRLEERLGIELTNHNKSIAGYLEGQESVRRKVLERARAQTSLNILEGELNQLLTIGGQNLQNLNELQQQRVRQLESIVENSRHNIQLLSHEIDLMNQNLSLSKSILNEFKSGAESLAQQYFTFIGIWNYLQKIDKEIRMNQLILGLSGEKAKVVRTELQDSVNAAAYLGAELKDIIEFQQAIATQTGRAYQFSKDENLMMMQIVKGTGLASEEAGRLVSTMMQFGTTVEASKSFIEETINSTARLGLSSNNVLKKVSANIDKLNTYRFQNGVKGLEQMAKYSETFKVSMENAFAAGEKFRTLEGLLDAGANLRVLGGEFAKMDEFKLSFLARNKPEEFTKELAKLTKGMAYFNKETGMFELSDVDFDRLRSVAETTGQDFGKLVESAKQFNKLDFAKKQILIGDAKDKEMIANLAQFKAGSSIGMIKVGSEFVKLTDLTDKHLSALRTEEKTLEQRTIDSQNFNDALTNLVSQLKATLLPALDLINALLTPFTALLNMARDEKTKELKGFMSIIPIGGMLISAKIMSSLWKWLASAITFNRAGGLAGAGQYGVTGGQIGPALPNQGGATNAGRGLAGMNPASLAAIGVAAVGIGLGFKMAAEGASALADSLAKLNSDQTKALVETMGILGVTIGATLVFSILALGYAGTAAAPGLLALGGAALMIGGAIGIAAAGIGYMANAQANLSKTIPETIKSMTELATIDVSNLNKVGKELSSMSTVSVNNLIPLQNLKFVDKDIENMKQMAALLAQINSIDTSKLNALGKLFSEGTFKVQLEGNPVIHIENKIDVDGTVFYKKVERAVPIIVKKGFDTRSIDWKNV